MDAAAYQPGQLSLVLDPTAKPVLVTQPISLIRVQPSRQRRPNKRVGPEENEQEDPPAKRTRPPKKKKKEAKPTSQERHASDDRSDRTVFIGNVPVTTDQKAIRRLLVGKGVIETIRFRSASFSTPKLPKKAAFITKQFHENRQSMNCYVVLAEASSVDQILAMNGTTMDGCRLRIDRVEPSDRDQKRCVFIGNLPFDVIEDDLFAFFASCGEIDYVRCVRDGNTNIGKGFAYVQFTERAAVKAALAFHDSIFKSRRLRVFKSKAEGGQAATRPARAKKGVAMLGKRKLKSATLSLSDGAMSRLR